MAQCQKAWLPSIRRLAVDTESAAQQMTTLGNLFKANPSGWGLRGDPYLWAEFAARFENVPMPVSESALRSQLYTAFKEITGVAITSPQRSVYIARFAHGGMSSGHISPEFWREQGFPLVIERFHACQA